MTGDLRAVAVVAVGAAVGGVARYLIGAAFLQRLGPGFPWSTLVINVTGSFLLGIVVELALTRAYGITPLVRIFVATGVLGGYTTFSAFSLDTLTLAGDGAFAPALAYAAGSVIVSVGATYAGMVIARLL
ncbi:MAG TPA: fluoride efflux transporter CrcB [Candidatus Baltobacteraceae bacterium]|nr:fluoride efflux transporter CrcB [Candidatus Baltobacteraceae bacterium]